MAGEVRIERHFAPDRARELRALLLVLGLPGEETHGKGSPAWVQRPGAARADGEGRLM
jgi:hypothetical protein